MDKNAYDLLGVATDATERDVRRAYRALLFELEDKGQSDPEAPQKRQKLEEAFKSCLSDAQNRGQKSVSSLPALDTVDPEAVKKKLVLRLALGLFAIAALFAGFQYFQNQTVDVGGESHSDTVGMIAALETSGKGTKAVVIKADGTKVDVPGHEDGGIDRDIAWRPDGNRLLFVSDRKDGNFNIFRWDVLSDHAELRSVGNRAKSNLWFGWEDSGTLRDKALFTSGGFVMKFDQKTTKTEQILPPVRGKTQGSDSEGEGAVGQMDQIYKKIGEAFVTAKWGIDRQTVWTVMRRETDFVYVMNPLTPAFNKGLPIVQFAAKAIEFDVNPGGDSIAALREFQFLDPATIPEKYLKDGKPVLPFNSGIYFCPADGSQPAMICHTRGSDFFFAGVGQQPKPMFSLPKSTLALAQPTISKDGNLLVFVLGKLVGEREFEGLSLIALPLNKNTLLQNPARIAIGAVSDPNFSPDGTKVTYLKIEADKRRAIYTANIQGGVETKVSSDGDFMTPKFSPQMAATTSTESK